MTKLSMDRFWLIVFNKGGNLDCFSKDEYGQRSYSIRGRFILYGSQSDLHTAFNVWDQVAMLRIIEIASEYFIIWFNLEQDPYLELLY